MPWTNPALTGWTCTRREQEVSGEAPRRCGCCEPPSPVLAAYDLPSMVSDPPGVPSDPGGEGIWRFAPLLPVLGVSGAYAADVGGTPLVRHDALGQALELEVWLKAARGQPGDSDEARGWAVAVAHALAQGAEGVALAAHGPAGVAAACLAARLELPCALFLPAREESGPHPDAARHFGAEVRCVGDDLDACQDALEEAHREALADGECVDLRTEPGRVEGLKSLGLELVAELGTADLPAAIVYPSGDAAALVGIWKAFQELDALGVLETASPQLFAVQPETCQPLVRAYSQGLGRVLPTGNQGSRARGLEAPSTPFGEAALRALRQSQGGAIAVSEEAIAVAHAELGRAGVPAGPEGAAGWAGLRELVDRGDLAAGARVLVCLP